MAQVGWTGFVSTIPDEAHLDPLLAIVRSLDGPCARCEKAQREKPPARKRGIEPDGAGLSSCPACFRRRRSTPASAGPQYEEGRVRHRAPRARPAVGRWPVVPCVGIACCLLGWVGTVLGPTAFRWLGVAGFAIGALGWKSSRAQDPRLGSVATGAGAIERWRFRLEGLVVLVGCLALRIWRSDDRVRPTARNGIPHSEREGRRSSSADAGSEIPTTSIPDILATPA